MLRAVDYYVIECDHPGCEVDTSSFGDYSAYSDSGSAHDEWVNSDGYEYQTLDGNSLYFCREHSHSGCENCDEEDDVSMVLDGEFLCMECFEDRISVVGKAS